VELEAGARLTYPSDARALADVGAPLASRVAKLLVEA
jgi:hypothetical protein